MDQAARAKLDEVLVSRQVVLVTGKGGVGKSVVAAALALRAKSLGLRPLLFECDAPTRPSLLPKGKPAGREVREVSPGILAINQASDDAIRDYAAASLPSKALADLLLENRVARLFLKAAPSVSEMALVGRVGLLAESHGAEGPVIVDLHATGHALSLLRAPAGIMKVLRKGPVYDRAKKVGELLYDPVRTSLLTVAVPEELPVTETLELVAAARQMGAPAGPIVLNAYFLDPAPDVDDATIAAAAAAGPDAARAVADMQALRVWARRSAREARRLEDELKAQPNGAQHPVIALPFVFEEHGSGSLAARLAAHLDDARAAEKRDGGRA